MGDQRTRNDTLGICKPKLGTESLDKMLELGYAKSLKAGKKRCTNAEETPLGNP